MNTQEDAEVGGGIGLHVIRTLARTVEFDMPYGSAAHWCAWSSMPHKPLHLSPITRVWTDRRSS